MMIGVVFGMGGACGAGDTEPTDSNEDSARLKKISTLYDESRGSFLNKLRAARFRTQEEEKDISKTYNPILASAFDHMVTSTKTPYILTLIALLSFLARRHFKIDDKYAAADEGLKEAKEALFDLIPTARTKPWYKPLTFYVYDDAQRSIEEQAGIVKAYKAYEAALTSYRRWRSGLWGSKLGMYGGAAGAVGSAALRAHEKG